MKKFEAPKMHVQKLAFENILTESAECHVEALGCASCYCIAVDCDNYTPTQCPDCFDNTTW